MKTKTRKTPLMVAEACGLTCCPFGLVLKSELLSTVPKTITVWFPNSAFMVALNPALRAEKGAAHISFLYRFQGLHGFMRIEGQELICSI